MAAEHDGERGAGEPLSILRGGSPEAARDGARPGPPVIALDVGGSSIKGALVTATARLALVRRVPTPAADEPALVEAVLAAAGALAEWAAAEGTPAAAIGVAAAGVIDESAGIARHGANLRWRDTAVAGRLEQGLGLPTALLQDARAAARGEAILGAGRGAGSFLSLILGTGVGSAVVVEGRPIQGAHGLAGEIGHLQVDPHGLRCGCGGRGCVETVASAAALARRYVAATGHALRAEAVLQRAARGDRVARSLWSDAISALATALAAAVAVVDCDLVVVGGGMAAAGPPLFDQLRSELVARISLAPPPELVPASLGNAAGVFGAAAAALERLDRGDVIRSWRALPAPARGLDGPLGADGGRRWNT